MSGRFSDAKHEQFDKDLGELVQRYLDQTDVDALALAIRCEHRARHLQFIGLDERRKFKEATK